MTDQSPLTSVDALASFLGDPDVRVLDCRFNLLEPDAGYTAYLAGHIPGAVYAHLDRDLAGPVTPESGRHPLPDVAEFERFLGRAGINNSSRVIVYDDSTGAIAARAWWLLRWLGHRQVALLDGGLKAWIAAGHTLEAGDVDPVPAQFRGQPQADRVISTTAVEGALQHGELLLDARAAERFQGKQEPIDSVAGHIPGAVNMPFERSLDADGGWRPAAELQQVWAEILGADLSGPWAVMCGSGVTACHLAISALVAGLPEPRLYVGSWSEWIRDPGRPMAACPSAERT